MRIHVLALNGVFDTGLATILDALGTASELAELNGSASKLSVEVVAVRKRIKTSLGLSVPTRSASTRSRPDAIIVPALGAKMPRPLLQEIERPEVADAQAWLREHSKHKPIIAAACTGTFVLAGSGLLDGDLATTSWWLAPAFRKAFPKIRLEESNIIVRGDKRRHLITAGAALAHVDLGLWLIRKRSPTLAATTARYLLADARPSQAAYVIPDQLAHDDAVVRRFERWTRAHLADGFDLETAAKAVRVSPRTLARRLESVLGKTPVAYVQELRIERAVQLLQTSDASVDEIAERVGYAQGSTLRTLLRRRLGRGVRELRG